VTPSDSMGPKTGGRCKQRAIVFCDSRVIGLVNFFLKFVAMTTGVGRGEIYITRTSDSPGPKIEG